MTVDPSWDPSASFDVSMSWAGRAALVTVRGEVDLATAPTLEAELVQAATHTGGVIVDLSGVAFIDSSGLGALIRAHSCVRPGCLLLVCAPDSVVIGTLRVTGMDQLFVIAASPDEALAHLAIGP